MPLTLLFDLDDTLLSNDFDRFLPAYLRLLGKHLANHIAPEIMVHELLAATQKMVQNNDPSLTLEKAFDAAFYPAIGKTKTELYATLDDFYDRVFVNLESITVQKPAAPLIVKEAFNRGHTVIVATNPLFPLKAVHHRLRWAGLPAEDYPFAALTSYENYHFSKPNPAYYAEILGQLGWPNQPAVVIGNSLEDDIMPAAELDLPGYWISDSQEALPAGLHPLTAKGTLEGVLAWTETIEAAGLTSKINSPAGLISVLKSTGAAFDTFARKLTEKQWQQRPQPAEWSITEILCHMRDVDLEINIPRIQKVASGSNPFLPGINSDSWTDERSYCEQDGLTALHAFIEARLSLIGCLENLSPQAWKFPARHAIFGPTYLQELVSFMSTHDRSHIQQVVTSATLIK
jgi:FMN phosphatase YigB (HAD superfamily)